MSEEELEEEGSPGVPTDLLELHLELEANSTSPEEFQEVYGE